MTKNLKYKKSGYFDFESLEHSENGPARKYVDIEILEKSNDKIKDFKISTDKYKKTKMKIRTVKYEIKD